MDAAGIATRGQSSDFRARERRRLQRHFRGALDELQRSNPSRLTDAQLGRREALIVELARYAATGRFPVNRTGLPMTPVFVDEAGTRCAVANLLEATGQGDLVEAISSRRNLAYVRELADEPELLGWLDEHGLTLAETQRIQPMYYPTHDFASWEPAISVVAGAQFGLASEGGQNTLAPGFRVGIRRDVRYVARRSRRRALALMAEYTRGFTLGTGSTNQVSLLIQWEPGWWFNKVQWYTLGGPLASIDENDSPGDAFGLQLGLGISFRRRTVPLLFEFAGQGLARSGDFSFRLGLNVGAVW